MALERFANAEEYESYVADKMREWGMSDATKVREWLDEVFLYTYYTCSIVLPYEMQEVPGILVLNSTAESTQQYHANVQEHE